MCDETPVKQFDTATEIIAKKFIAHCLQIAMFHDKLQDTFL